ncbi:hypothetical protein BDN67DRAFT_982637 [Paxillus ammoniavirescens]|nr:hypothetical protein BDN67DRAFT_982637 [Paxillus ammoniavirescens]
MSWDDLLGYPRTCSALHTFKERKPSDSENPGGPLEVRFWNAWREGAVTGGGKWKWSGQSLWFWLGRLFDMLTLRFYDTTGTFPAFENTFKSTAHRTVSTPLTGCIRRFIPYGRQSLQRLCGAPSEYSKHEIAPPKSRGGDLGGGTRPPGVVAEESETFVSPFIPYLQASL